MFRKIKRLFMLLWVLFVNRYYLINGIYIFKYDCFIKVSSIGDFFKGIPFVVFSFKKKRQYKKMNFRYGAWSNKYSFFFEDYIVFFVKKITIKQFRMFINNVQLIKYPVMKIDDYCIKKCSYSCSKIFGHSPTSEEESIDICFLLLKYAEESNIVISNQTINSKNIKVVSYLQHGDPGLANVIIENGNPIFIDLDNIGYYPALYDFFDMIFNKMKLYGFQLFNDGFFDSKLFELFKKIHVVSFNNLDFYMSLYIDDKIAAIKKNKWDVEAVASMWFIQNLKYINKSYFLSKEKAKEIRVYNNTLLW